MDLGRDGERLFVYGTLCRAADRQMSARLVGQCTFVGRASITGRLYEIDGYPGLICPGRRGELVLGELYRLEQPLTLLAQLDDYEECSPHFPAPHEYVRKQLTVRLDDGREALAWTYLYNRDVSDRCHIVSGDYLSYRLANK